MTQPQGQSQSQSQGQPQIMSQSEAIELNGPVIQIQFADAHDCRFRLSFSEAPPLDEAHFLIAAKECEAMFRRIQSTRLDASMQTQVQRVDSPNGQGPDLMPQAP